MVDQIETLKQLQEIDRQRFRLRRQQQEKPQELSRAERTVASQEASVRSAEEQLKAMQIAQKEKEMELQSHEAKIKKLQGQLFQVKTNREYAAMQHEIASLKADASLLEEAALKLFDEIDQATKARDERRQRLTVDKEQVEAERTRVERELAEIGERIGKLERQRQSVAPEVPATTLATYERVLDIREGIALVPLVNESCGGCHRRLRPQVINEVYLKAKLVICESCSRILYLDETRSQL